MALPHINWRLETNLYTIQYAHNCRTCTLYQVINLLIRFFISCWNTDNSNKGVNLYNGDGSQKSFEIFSVHYPGYRVYIIYGQTDSQTNGFSALYSRKNIIILYNNKYIEDTSKCTCPILQVPKYAYRPLSTLNLKSNTSISLLGNLSHAPFW